MSEAEVLFALQVHSSPLFLVELHCSVVRLQSCNFLWLQNRIHGDFLNNETGYKIFKDINATIISLYVSEIWCR